MCGFMPQLHTVKLQFPKDKMRRQFYSVIKRVCGARRVLHSFLTWFPNRAALSCLFNLNLTLFPTEHAKRALWCAGALWVVATPPQVLLDVGGHLHHVRPHPGLHLPVWEFHALLVQHDRHGQGEVSLATDPPARTGYFSAAPITSPISHLPSFFTAADWWPLWMFKWNLF